jgi:hypothetical protein
MEENNNRTQPAPRKQGDERDWENQTQQEAGAYVPGTPHQHSTEVNGRVENQPLQNEGSGNSTEQTQGAKKDSASSGDSIPLSNNETIGNP